MKELVLCAALAAGGAAWYLSDSPDFDRVVKKSPMQVYAAFSALAQQGTVTPPGQRGSPSISFRVDKVNGQSIHYEVQFDRTPVVTADLNFAAAGEDGRQTRMTAEVDIDASALGEEFETDAGVALAFVQDRVIDGQFARFMDQMVDEVEAGRPLPPLGTQGLGVRQAASRHESDPDYRRARADARQRAAVRPMNDARPMVDPNRSARRYLRGDSQSGGWGR